MTTEALIRKYLGGDDARVMQVATTSNKQPWLCTVWFVVDDELNLYWLSLPSRRHSQEVADNPKVAAAIVIKQDMPTIGLQLEGTAGVVTDQATVARVMKKYVAKYKEGEFFYDRLIAGKNQHALYCMRPSLYVLFDGQNVPGDGRAEWRL